MDLDLVFQISSFYNNLDLILENGGCGLGIVDHDHGGARRYQIFWLGGTTEVTN